MVMQSRHQRKSKSKAKKSAQKATKKHIQLERRVRVLEAAIITLIREVEALKKGGEEK